MGQGSYVICEWNSIQKSFPEYEKAVKDLELTILQKCDGDWSPRTCGYLTPKGTSQYGRTTILPELFDDHNGAQMQHWRQQFLLTGHQILMTGTRAGSVIPEDFKIAIIGVALPNKQQNLSEIRMYIGDKKLGRLDIEEVKGYNLPAFIFEEGVIIDEETSFDMWGFIKNPDYQRIVLLGATYFKQIDRVLGNPGAAI